MRLSWRAAVTVSLGLLLALPLVLLTGVLFGLWVTPPPKQPDVVPMLPSAERMQRLTYKHDCDTNADCEPPLACVLDSRMQRLRCLDSDCETNLDCGEGMFCQTLATESEHGKPHVRLCAAHGHQTEGQPCEPLPRSKQRACEPGLVCYGWCARPCEPEKPESCPEGFKCLTGIRGAACLQQCLEGTCPEGQRCFPSGRQLSACTRVQGPACDLTPCPEGLDCVPWYQNNSGNHTEVVTQCVSPCGEGLPPCPEGRVCHDGHCYRPCNPKSPEDCGADVRCNLYVGRWLCESP